MRVEKTLKKNPRCFSRFMTRQFTISCIIFNEEAEYSALKSWSNYNLKLSINIDLQQGNKQRKQKNV